jgi:hypothetical protein
MDEDRKGTVQMRKQILSEIVEGMDVYDSDGMRIGTVEGIHQGEGAEKANSTDIDNIKHVIDLALGNIPDLPDETFTRMFEQGFIHVKRGLLRRDCVVFPEQIDDIGEENVYLNIENPDITKL